MLCLCRAHTAWVYMYMYIHSCCYLVGAPRAFISLAGMEGWTGAWMASRDWLIYQGPWWLEMRVCIPARLLATGTCWHNGREIDQPQPPPPPPPLALFQSLPRSFSYVGKRWLLS